MSQSDPGEGESVKERWPHMPLSQKWLFFGLLCVYGVLSAYTPVLLGWEDRQWGRATIEALTYTLVGAFLIWIVFPSVTDWIQHGVDR